MTMVSNCGMTIPFGKHHGKSVGALVLKQPGYVLWMLRQEDATGRLADACDEASRLIEVFDSKPFLMGCAKDGCTKQATRCSLYQNNLVPMWWCDDHDPYGSGAFRGKLSIVRSYWDAVNHVYATCGARQADLKILIRTLAEAKGLPPRAGARQIMTFFG